MVINYVWHYNGVDQRIVVSNATASDEIIVSISAERIEEVPDLDGNCGLN